MTDMAQGVPEGETPVNPYSLLEAVNRSSDTAHTAWLIFVAVMAYLVIAVAGVTHKDLLLETPVALPILQVDIPLAQFFQFAPILLVVFHLGIVSQLSLLARETLEFDKAIRLLEVSDKRLHPLRLELNNYFFVQAIAGPYRSRVMSVFLHGMSWLTLVTLPVLLLVYIQVVFLPYHDVWITWIHRVAILADIAMLISIGVFLMRPETSFFEAFWRTTAQHPISFFATLVSLVMVGLFSLFFATIPGEELDRMTQKALGFENEDEVGPASRIVAGFAVPLLSFGSDGSLFGIFRRNLVVMDTDLVPDKDTTPGEPSLSLRGRDLRFAKLDRSDLHQVDLTGADLRGASLTGTDLRGAWLHCADLMQLVLTDDRGEARCTTARRVNLTRARLEEAHMTGIDLRAAKLEEARLEGAELPYSMLQGANFSSAKLDKADLTGGVQAQGASFLIASLQGADLTGAQLQGADLSSAYLQAAIFSYARLDMANLRDSELEAASFFQASLVGSDLRGVRFAAADFRGVRGWMSRPPDAFGQALADFSDVSFTSPGEGDISATKAMLESVVSQRLRGRLAEQFQPLLDIDGAAKWAESEDRGLWDRMTYSSTPAAPDLYKAQISDYLAKLQCRSRWNNGAIATGIARRALARQFRGDLLTIYDSLRADTCQASRTINAKVMRELSSAADILRGN